MEIYMFLSLIARSKALKVSAWMDLRKRKIELKESKERVERVCAWELELKSETHHIHTHSKTCICFSLCMFDFSFKYVITSFPLFFPSRCFNQCLPKQQFERDEAKAHGQWVVTFLPVRETHEVESSSVHALWIVCTWRRSYRRYDLRSLTPMFLFIYLALCYTPLDVSSSTSSPSLTLDVSNMLPFYIFLLVSLFLTCSFLYLSLSLLVSLSLSLNRSAVWRFSPQFRCPKSRST